VNTINRYICIHGHFYQPPRENPWLEEIEVEESAFPFHDWNERVTAECYAPNAASRILGSDRRIIDIVNNYSNISFNFGPTLLSWLETHNPEVYSEILRADKDSLIKFSGHGSAIAQIYNHLIMPLACSRDKRTEIIWGIKDFVYRFGRIPEGMWLSETAVDIETLEILAEHGIRFTILAPHQAKRIRRVGHQDWTYVTKDTLHIGMPYLCILPSGKKIAIFFYNAVIGAEAAFGHLLDNGETFAKRMIDSFPQNTDDPYLLSIATDGETYGHHHRFADMALAYALHDIESKKSAQITVYGEYLEKYPPTHEVAIAENTSWSCIHGVKRWEDDCGCRAMYACLISDTSVCYLLSSGSTSQYNIKPWNQKWRKPLRGAIQWLSTELARIYEHEMEGLFHEPWTIRDAYGELIINRSYDAIIAFFSNHSKRTPNPQEITRCLKLLEMQKNSLFMQTSCGWFFDDLAGIETIQILMYACRAIQISRDITGVDLEPDFLTQLSKATSNLSTLGNGKDIYEKYVQTSIFDINRVAFQFAITSLIGGIPDTTQVSMYDIYCNTFEQAETGTIKLAVGHAQFRSKSTLKESHLMFAALHMGGHNFMGGIRPFSHEKEYDEIKEDIWISYRKSDLLGMILQIDRHFDVHSYSLWHLFRDGKRKVLYNILDGVLLDIEYEYRQLYRRYSSLVTAMKELRISSPKALDFPIEYTLNRELITCIDAEMIDISRIAQILDDMNRGNYVPERKTLSVHAGRAILRSLEKIAEDPTNLLLIIGVNRLFTLLAPLSLTLDLWACQNTYHRIGEKMCPLMKEQMNIGDENAKRWVMEYSTLGEYLGIRCSL